MHLNSPTNPGRVRPPAVPTPLSLRGFSHALRTCPNVRFQQASIFVVDPITRTPASCLETIPRRPPRHEPWNNGHLKVSLEPPRHSDKNSRAQKGCSNSIPSHYSAAYVTGIAATVDLHSEQAHCLIVTLLQSNPNRFALAHIHGCDSRRHYGRS